MGLLTILKKVKQEERNVRILVLGLDNAGKSSIVKRLCGHHDIDDVEPTLGFRIETLDYHYCDSTSSSNSTTNSSNNNPSSTDGSGDVKSTSNSSHSSNNPGDSTGNEDNLLRLHLWDIGGQSTIRAYWRNYFEQTDGLIWVVDSSDVIRLDLVAQELQSTLKQEKLEGATLLVFANKIDLVAPDDGCCGDDDGDLGGDKDSVEKQEAQTRGEETVRDDTAATGTTSTPTRTKNTNAGQVAETLVTSRLQLSSLVQYENRHWNVVPCSALTGDGLQQGIDWLVRDIQSRLSYC